MKKEPKYRCSQPELYAVARTGWNSFSQYILAFGDMRGFYDEAYANGAQTQITDAEAMPESQSRYAQSEVNRTELQAQADECLAKWQLLKRYISSSFNEAALKARMDEAGAMRYEKAGNYNWEELRMMNVQAVSFLNTHVADLSAGNNMPAAFPNVYTAAANLYSTRMQAYFDSEEAAYAETENKIAANNLVYDKLINMFKDGQEIFKNQEGIKNQFVFDSVLTTISGTRQAGVKGTVISAADNLPVAGAIITVAGSSKTATTDESGHYEIRPLAAGTYNLLVTAAGYTALSISAHPVITGTVSTLNLSLQTLP